jgi:aspartate/methionine/tyrosine aminotransferase
VRAALAGAADSPGYPATYGTPGLREAAAGWLARCHGVTISPAAILPVIGTKELVAWLPTLLGCGPGDAVIHPSLAYPTYDVGARLAGARPVRADALGGSRSAGSGSAGSSNAASSNAASSNAGSGSAGSSNAGSSNAGPGSAGSSSAGSPATAPDATGPDGPDGLDGLDKAGIPERIRLAWLNSPSNPTGEVLPMAALRAAVAWARARGVVLASDECYIGLGWEAEPASVLHPDVCDGSHEGLLAVHSLSKRSNLAGYRAGFVAGDPALVAALLEVRKHAGMIVPGPVQAAMTVALDDDVHAGQQRARYAARRGRLWPALQAAGWAIDHSAAGLYLWASHPAYDGRASVEVLAAAGILVAPGEFYGPSGDRHIRVALTATDERVESAASRLGELPATTA